jgi:hypothetical protein
MLTFLVRSYRHEPGVVPLAHAIDLVRESAAFDAARRLAAQCQQHLERLAAQDTRLREDHVASSAVADLVARLWSAGYRPGAAQDRGFPALRAVVKAARPLVPYLAARDWQSPDPLLLLPDLPPGWRCGARVPALRR